MQAELSENEDGPGVLQSNAEGRKIGLPRVFPFCLSMLLFFSISMLASLVSTELEHFLPDLFFKMCNALFSECSIGRFVYTKL